MKRNRIYRMTRAVSFSISLLSICIPAPFAISPSPSPSHLSLPLSTESFLCPLCSALSSPFSLSPSLRTPSSFAPWSRSVSAFIDRSQNDLAHVSYSSWRSGVGGLDFSSLPSPPRDFLFFSSRRDAARLGADSIPPSPRRPAPLAGRRLAAAPRHAARRCTSH